MTFEEWKINQDINLEGWHKKYWSKISSSKQRGLICYLTFEEYLFKAYEVGIMHPSEIARDKYHLSRISDEGDYKVNNCRFLWYLDNHREKDFSYIRNRDFSYLLGHTHTRGHTNTQGEKHGKAKLTNEQVITIYFDSRLHEEIAKDYNVSTYVIYRIKTKERWSSVTNSLPNTLEEYLITLNIP